MTRQHGLYLSSYSQNSLIMRCYLNFIFLSINLLLVQSDDLDSNYFYQNLLMTTTYQSKFLSTSSLPIKGKSPILYRHGFYEQSYSKIQITTSSTVLYTLRSFNRRSIYFYPTLPASVYREYHTRPTRWNNYPSIYCGRRATTCGQSPYQWCCYGYGNRCGTTHNACNAPEDNTNKELFMFMMNITMIFGVITCCSVGCAICNHTIMQSDSRVVQSDNPVIQSDRPVSNNSSSVQQEQTSALSNWLSRDLEVTRQGTTENINLQSLESQSLIRSTLLRNSIDSMEPRLTAIDNFSIRRATTSSSLPAYDDVMHRNSITITIEQEFILPPTYDDFMQESHRREETSL